MWFSLTCVDEGAEGEGAVLFIKGEIEDVQVADAGYPHWLTVFDVTITVDISHETWRGLICIHAECEKDREVKAVGSPSDLALILSQVAHFCAPAPLTLPPPSTYLCVLGVSDATPFCLNLCLAPIGYIMLFPGNMVSFLLFTALTLTAPQWRYLEATGSQLLCPASWCPHIPLGSRWWMDCTRSGEHHGMGQTGDGSWF